MDIHEYQARERFRAAGIPVPPGRVVTTPKEAELAAEEYGGTVVIKAQVHSGGRGKAGGVRLAEDAAEARRYTSQILSFWSEISPISCSKGLNRRLFRR